MLLGAFFASDLWANEYPFTWVNYQGRKVKKWEITNGKYYYKRVSNRSLAQSKKVEPSQNTSVVDGPIYEGIQSSALRAGLKYGITGLDTTDKSNNSTAAIYFDSNIGLDLQWEFGMGKWTHFIGSSFEKISFNQGNQTISDTDVNLLGIRLGSFYGDGYQLGGYIQYRQYPFLAVENSNFTIETAPLPSAGLSFRDNLINGSKWSLDYGIFAEYIMSGKLSSANVDSGIKSGALVETVQKLSSFDLMINLGVDYKNQGSSDIEQNQLDVKTGIGIKIDF